MDPIDESETFNDLFAVTPSADDGNGIMSMSTPQPSLQDQVTAMQQAMMAYFEHISSRITEIESFVTQINAFIGEKRRAGVDVVNQISDMPSTTASATQIPTPFAHSTITTDLRTPMEVSSRQAPLGEKPMFQYSLELENVPVEFFTERAFPPFVVRLVNTTTRQIIREANDWCVYFRLLDGYGRYADDKLADEKTRRQYLIHGQTEVNGLKFKQVSSKNGGHFKLEATLMSPTDEALLTEPAISDEITILSCRLFQCRKGSLSRLEGLEPISKLPGIGRQYALRLLEQGYRTIADLAALPLDDHVQQDRVLGAIRKEKGTLTKSKLIDYIRTAQAISTGTLKRAREDAEDDPDAARCVKRVKGLDPIDPMEFSTPFDDNETGIFAYLNSSFVETSDRGFSSSFSFNDECRGVGDTPRDDSESRISISTPGVSPLLVAVATRKLMFVKLVIARLQEKGLPLDSIQSNPISGLMFAASLGAVDIVSYLTSLSNIHVEQSRADGWTALHFAACSGNEDVVKALLLRTGPIGKTSSGWTPLLLAIKHRHVGVVKILLEEMKTIGLSPVSIMEGNLLRGVGPFHLACLVGSLEIVSTLAKFAPASFHTSVSESSPSAPSLLHCAAYSGDPLVISFLLSNGCNPKSTCDGNWTPLHIAAARKLPVAVKQLCASSDVNALTSDGFSPLSLAALSNKPIEHRAEGYDDDADSAQSVSILLASGATDSGVPVPASAVSIVCENMSALLELQSDVNSISHTIQVCGKSVDICEMSKSLASDVMADVIESLIP